MIMKEGEKMMIKEGMMMDMNGRIVKRGIYYGAEREDGSEGGYDQEGLALLTPLYPAKGRAAVRFSLHLHHPLVNFGVNSRTRTPMRHPRAGHPHS